MLRPLRACPALPWHRLLSTACPTPPHDHTVLGIETSCDDTGLAVVSSDGVVHAATLASQWSVHAPHGGIVPRLAARAHEEHFDRLLAHTLSSRPPRVDAVAVTAGPGLAPCLRVGVRKAQDLAARWKVPLVPINHLEAHVLVARLSTSPPALAFPFLSLVVSGGHTMLALVRGIGTFERLGTTLDDAVGEAFDKVARLLGLGYGAAGGGAALEVLARDGDAQAIPFPVPLQRSARRRAGCDFSFSGLKTAVKYATDTMDLDDRQTAANVAASFQRVAVAHLVQRVGMAADRCKARGMAVPRLVVCGGVARNGYLRRELSRWADAAGMDAVFPAPELCTDNGIMVAWAGVERLVANDFTLPPLPDEVRGTRGPNRDEVQYHPRWPL